MKFWLEDCVVAFYRGSLMAPMSVHTYLHISKLSLRPADLLPMPLSIPKQFISTTSQIAIPIFLCSLLIVRLREEERCAKWWHTATKCLVKSFKYEAYSTAQLMLGLIRLPGCNIMILASVIQATHPPIQSQGGCSVLQE